MGYAIPITTAKPVIEELMQHETKRKVSDNERSFLGISGTDVTSDVSATYDMPKGVYVVQEFSRAILLLPLTVKQSLPCLSYRACWNIMQQALQ